jgi:serine acetyltransferase
MVISLFFLLRRRIIKNKFSRFFLYPIYRFIGMIYSSSIPLKSKLGKKLKFKHGLFGIFIAGGATIGNNVTFYHQVTIGGVSGNSKNKGSPVIGDHTILYPGCKVIGNVTIGKNCKIGPNVVVFEDIPDNTTVVFSRDSFRYINTEECV